MHPHASPNRLVRTARRAAPTGLGLALLAGAAGAQQPVFTSFNDFTPGLSVDGQGGWSATNPNWDEEIVDLGGGNLAWRVSNAFTSGSFGDQPIAPGSDLYAGESSSVHLLDGAAPVTNRFFASFDFWSATGAAQPGLDVTVSPDDGSGSRQSFLSIEDNGAGIDIEFFDSQANNPVTNPNGGFVSTDIVTGLSYGDVHNLAIDITFVDGNVIDGNGDVYGNDIVRIYVDGQLVHTGTTWESYYWTTTEGQVAPTVRAVDTLLFRLSTNTGFAPGGGYVIDNVFVSTKCPEDFQGFETDLDGWEVFSSTVFYPQRVPSGTNGVPSASGDWHAVASATNGEVPAGNWGGYGGNCGCASTSCGASPFPTHGYTTSIDVYLDLEGGWADDTRFDYSSAISRPDGSFRRDFIFNAGFYSAADGTSPGAGQDRFIVSASNNSGQPPFNPPAAPVAITETGWYTFQQRFYATTGNVLAVEMTVRDTSGVVLGSWTRSNPADIVNVTVGGNRYAWFPVNQFDDLAFDNATRFTGGTAELALTAVDCQDDAHPAPGQQIAVTLEMRELTSAVSGFQAFVEYPMGSLLYRGDLSSYSAAPFPVHVSPIVQGDDGRLELDGSDLFGGSGTTEDALLATLVFDVLPTCTPTVPAAFEVGGAFDSKLSYLGAALETTFVDADAVALDDTPPVLVGVPADLVRPADAGSCLEPVVTWTDPVATDDCDLAPTVVCSPPSGSVFPVGTTTVTCTATDACGNVAVSSFDVTVTPTNAVDVVVELTGSMPTSRCIRFVPDDCGAGIDVTLDFLGSAPAVAVATIEIPCGAWTKLCAKDEQHTKWGEATLSLVGSKYVLDAPLVLDGGDTDNDGGVDINDVTLFLAQFGTPAAFGGCPWDGVTKDADFLNDGFVGSEDYALLVANWLTTSDCSCGAPATTGISGRGEGRRSMPVRDALGAAADLDRNGLVDWRDVELLERRNGLSGELSRLMRD